MIEATLTPEQGLQLIYFTACVGTGMLYLILAILEWEDGNDE